MCKVLQILVFCVPFYDLLDKLSRRAAHNFKSETPLVDAMSVSDALAALRSLLT